jgi:hypothetical protein
MIFGSFHVSLLLNQRNQIAQRLLSIISLLGFGVAVGSYPSSVTLRSKQIVNK